MNIINIIKAPYLRFSSEASSQDLLKAIALLTMIIDHVGMVFFPEDLYLRAIGRSSFVIWFFFVGYNFRERKSLIDMLLFCAVSFAIAKYFFIPKILPFNILFSMIISRVMLGYYAKYIVKNESINLFEWFFLSITLLALFLLTNSLFEYGTLGILIAILGYNKKNKIGNDLIQIVSLSFITSFSQIDAWKFNFNNSIISLISINLALYALYYFKPISISIRGVSRSIINIMARYSLYLYCLHLLLFFALRWIFL
jgi:hypothetical protein